MISERTVKGLGLDEGLIADDSLLAEDAPCARLLPKLGVVLTGEVRRCHIEHRRCIQNLRQNIWLRILAHFNIILNHSDVPSWRGLIY